MQVTVIFLQSAFHSANTDLYLQFPQGGDWFESRLATTRLKFILFTGTN